MRRLHEFDEPKTFALQYFPLALRDQTIGLFAGAFKRTRQRCVGCGALMENVLRELVKWKPIQIQKVSCFRV